MASAIKYVSNISKSITYSAIDRIRDLNPAIKDLADQNSEIGKILYESVTDIKGTSDRIKQYVKGTDVFEAASAYKKNLFEDLTTGKFYNRERIDQTNIMLGEQAMGSFELDGDPFKDFDLDNLDFDFDDDINIGDDDLFLANSMDLVGEKTSSAINMGTARSADYIVQSNKQGLKGLAKHNTYLADRMQLGMGSLNSSINNLIDFNNNAMVKHIDNSSKFYTEITKLDQERNDILKKILENQQKTMTSLENKAKESDRISFDDIIGAEGAPNLKIYGKRVFQNVKDLTGGMMDMSKMMGEDTNILMALTTSPLKFLTDTLVKNLTPKMVEKSMESLNETVGNYFANVIGKFNTMRNSEDSTLLNIIGKVFGISDSNTASIDTGKYNKGAIPFDGETKMAITQVIPMQLSQVVSALTGNPQKMYNYTSGKFVDIMGVKYNHDTVQDRHEKNAFSEITQAFSELLDKTMELSVEQKQAQMNAFRELQRESYEDNSLLNPSKKKYVSGLSEDELQIMKMVFGNIDPKVKMRVASNIQRERASQRKYYENINNNSSDITRILYSGYDINQAEYENYRANRDTRENFLDHEYKKFDYKNRKNKGSIIDSDLTHSRDNLGNNIFDYLQRLTSDIELIRYNFLNNLGNGGISGIHPGSARSLAGSGSSYRGNNEFRGLSENSILSKSRDDYYSYLRKEEERALKEIEKYNSKNVESYILEDGTVISAKKATSEQKNHPKTKVNSVKYERVNLEKLMQKADEEGWDEETRILRFQDAVRVAQKNNTNRDERDQLQDNYKQESNKKLAQFKKKLMESESVSDTLKNFAHGIDSVLKSPTKFLTTILDKVDQMMYKSIYGDPDNPDAEFSPHSFMATLTAKTISVFNNLGHFIKEDIFRPIKEELWDVFFKDKFTNTLDGFKGKIKDSKLSQRIFGEGGEVSKVGEFIRNAYGSYFGRKGGLLSHFRGNADLINERKRQYAENSGFNVDQLNPYDSNINSPFYNHLRSSMQSKINKVNKNTILNGAKNMAFSAGWSMDNIFGRPSYNENEPNIYYSNDVMNSKGFGLNKNKLKKYAYNAKYINDNRDNLKERIYGSKNIGANNKVKLKGYAHGARYINKTGLAVLSEGEMVIPSELNPYYTEKTDKKSQVRKEKGIKNRFSKFANNIPMFAEGTKYVSEEDLDENIQHKPGVKRIGNLEYDEERSNLGAETVRLGINSTRRLLHFLGINKQALSIKTKMKVIDNRLSSLVGENDQDKEDKLLNDAIKDVTGNFVQYLPTSLVGGGIGAGVSLLTGMIGGPLLGAAVGAATGLTLKSDKLKDFLFGEEIDGIRNGNVFNKKLSNAIFKQFPEIAKGATVGGLTAMIPFVPGGPLAGIMVGSAVGYVRSSEKAKSYLFGSIGEDGERIDDGLIKQSFLKQLKGSAPNALLGGAAGLILGGPFGLIGNTALGASLGMLSSTDKFQELLFGKFNEETKEYEGGLLSVVKKKFTDPLITAIQPLAKTLELGVKNLFSGMRNILDTIFKEELRVPLRRFFTQKIINPVGRVAKGVGKFLIKPAVNVASLPFQAVGAVGKYARGRLIGSGNANFMTAEERMDYRNTNKKGFFRRKFSGMNHDRFSEYDEMLTDMNVDDLSDLTKGLASINDPMQYAKDMRRDAISNINRAMDRDVFKGRHDYGISRKVRKYLRDGQQDKALNLINNSALPDADKEKLLSIVTSNYSDYSAAEGMMGDTKTARKDLLSKLSEKYGIDTNKIGDLEKFQKLANQELEIKKAQTPEEWMNDKENERHDELLNVIKDSADGIKAILSPEYAAQLKAEKFRELMGAKTSGKGKLYSSNIFKQGPEYQYDYQDGKYIRYKVNEDGLVIRSSFSEVDSDGEPFDESVDEDGNVVKKKKESKRNIDNEAIHKTIFDKDGSPIQLKKGKDGEWEHDLSDSETVETIRSNKEHRTMWTRMGEGFQSLGSKISSFFGFDDKVDDKEKSGLAKFFGKTGKVAKGGFKLALMTIGALTGLGIVRVGGEFIKNTVFPKIKTFWEEHIYPRIENVIAPIKPAIAKAAVGIDTVLSKIPTAIDNLGSRIKSFITNDLPYIWKEKILPFYGDTITWLAGNIKYIVQGGFKLAWQLLPGILSGAFMGLKDIFMMDLRELFGKGNNKLHNRIEMAKSIYAKDVEKAMPDSDSNQDGIMSRLFKGIFNESPKDVLSSTRTIEKNTTERELYKYYSGDSKDINYPDYTVNDFIDNDIKNNKKYNPIAGLDRNISSFNSTVDNLLGMTTINPYSSTSESNNDNSDEKYKELINKDTKKKNSQGKTVDDLLYDMDNQLVGLTDDELTKMQELNKDKSNVFQLGVESIKNSPKAFAKSLLKGKNKSILKGFSSGLHWGSKFIQGENGYKGLKGKGALILDTFGLAADIPDTAANIGASIGKTTGIGKTNSSESGKLLKSLTKRLKESKVFNNLKNFFFKNSDDVGKLTKTNKLKKWYNKVIDFFNNKMQKLLSKVPQKALSFIRIGAKVLAIAWTIADFINGWDKAADFFYILDYETNDIHRLIAGVCNMINENFIFGMLPMTEVVDFVYSITYDILDMFSGNNGQTKELYETELLSKRQNATYAVMKSNQKNETNYSIPEYNKKLRGTIISQTVDDLDWFLRSTYGDIKYGLKQTGSDIKDLYNYGIDGWKNMTAFKQIGDFFSGNGSGLMNLSAGSSLDVVGRHNISKYKISDNFSPTLALKMATSNQDFYKSLSNSKMVPYNTKDSNYLGNNSHQFINNLINVNKTDKDLSNVSNNTIPTVNIIDEICTIIAINETNRNYGTVVRNDSSSGMSIGKYQFNIKWTALPMLKRMCREVPDAKNILGETLYNTITKSTSMGAYVASEAEKLSIGKLITTDKGKRIQDEYMIERIQTVYFPAAKAVGLTDPRALIYFCDIAHQAGVDNAKKISSYALTHYGNMGLNELFNATIESTRSLYRDYKSRRDATYRFAAESPVTTIDYKTYNLDAVSSGYSFIEDKTPNTKSWYQRLFDNFDKLKNAFFGFDTEDEEVLVQAEDILNQDTSFKDQNYKSSGSTPTEKQINLTREQRVSEMKKFIKESTKQSQKVGKFDASLFDSGNMMAKGSFVSQLDPRYAYNKLGNDTVAEAGCGPATAAMAIDGLSANGSGDLMNQATALAQRYNNSNGTKASYFKDILSRAGANTEYIDGQDKNSITNRLSKGQQVILMGQDATNRSKQNSPFGPGNHYVLAKGIDKDRVLINDPELSGPKVYNKNILNNAKLGIAVSGKGSETNKPKDWFADLNKKFSSLNEHFFGIITETEIGDTSVPKNEYESYQGTNSIGLIGATIQDLLNYAKSFIGRIKYSQARRDDINNGGGYADCSSYVRHVFAKFGIALGTYTGTQIKNGEEVSKSQLKPGDLVMFKNTTSTTNYRGVTHVGIYLGNNEFIHCSSGQNGVVIASLSNSYWVTHWLCGRRVISKETTLKEVRNDIAKQKEYDKEKNNNSSSKFGSKMNFEAQGSYIGDTILSNINKANNINNRLNQSAMGSSNQSVKIIERVSAKSTASDGTVITLLKQIIVLLTQMVSNTSNVSEIVSLVESILEKSTGERINTKKSKDSTKSNDVSSLALNALRNFNSNNEKDNSAVDSLVKELQSIISV